MSDTKQNARHCLRGASTFCFCFFLRSLLQSLFSHLSSPISLLPPRRNSGTSTERSPPNYLRLVERVRLSEWLATLGVHAMSYRDVRQSHARSVPGSAPLVTAISIAHARSRGSFRLIVPFYQSTDVSDDAFHSAGRRCASSRKT